MDWGADPGARNHQVEREVRSFLKAAGRSKNEKIRELVLGKAREEQGSRNPRRSDDNRVVTTRGGCSLSDASSSVFALTVTGLRYNLPTYTGIERKLSYSLIK